MESTLTSGFSYRQTLPPCLEIIVRATSFQTLWPLTRTNFAEVKDSCLCWSWRDVAIEALPISTTLVKVKARRHAVANIRLSW
ncbi:hypothetical protein E2P81_ATG06880 [Venturia nashicola]|uniref:Uncharacterized protein n=1 Tax=Venturia nashicola TaxID=86259 RepID=A0A4Z1P5Q0_9PEZI|nr:hypothetical protein E6O75_ATG07051 [Venturia nashicola]TLD30227.1 hypothetical protein E2P81_ATG06880 [Venturia nashicola]